MITHPDVEKELSEVVSILPNSSTKIEALLAELIEAEKLDFEHLRFRQVGMFKRGYKLDVLKVDYPVPRPNELRKLYLELNREGLYDMLPYSLFHHSRQSDAFKSIDKLTEETKLIEDEEQQARSFFAPLEQEFIRARVNLELQERSLTSGFYNPLQEAIFNQFWKSDNQSILHEQLQVLFYLLPLTHKVAGNLELMRHCFSAVLLEEVEISYVAPTEDNFAQLTTPPLGKMELGVDTILGSTVAAELPSLFIKIGAVDLNNISGYLPGRPQDELLKFLCSYFVPVELDVKIEIELNRNPGPGKLDTIAPFALEQVVDATARLGFSTVI